MKEPGDGVDESVYVGNRKYVLKPMPSGSCRHCAAAADLGLCSKLGGPAGCIGGVWAEEPSDLADRSSSTYAEAVVAATASIFKNRTSANNTNYKYDPNAFSATGSGPSKEESLVQAAKEVLDAWDRKCDIVEFEAALGVLRTEVGRQN